MVHKLLIVFSLVFLLSGFEYVEQKKVEEYTAKAAFIYNFTKFIEWPENQSAGEFQIAVLKDCPIIAPLEQIAASKRVNERKISVSVLKSEELPGNCHILFIPSSIGSDRLTEVLKYYSGKQTLIITEKKGMLSKGSSINFLIEDQKIRFEINRKSIEKAQLNVSSQLLKLAKSVQQ